VFFCGANDQYAPGGRQKVQYLQKWKTFANFNDLVFDVVFLSVLDDGFLLIGTCTDEKEFYIGFNFVLFFQIGNGFEQKVQIIGRVGQKSTCVEYGFAIEILVPGHGEVGEGDLVVVGVEAVWEAGG